MRSARDDDADLKRAVTARIQPFQTTADTINIQGESYRLRQHRKAGLAPIWEPRQEEKSD